MTDLPLTDTERLAVLERLVQLLQGRIEILEQLLLSGGITPTENVYLQQQLFGAIEGSKNADSLNHFQ